MAYKFPEDYEQLKEDFLNDRHLVEAGPGSEQVSTTVSKQLAVRIRMLAMLDDTSISKQAGFLLNLGATTYEQALKKAAKRAEIQEIVNGLPDNS